MYQNFRERSLAFYEKNESRLDIAFFLGGFLLDVSMLPAIDDLFGFAQQIAYLLVIGAILIGELLLEARAREMPRWFTRVWEYRSLIVHFSLGAVLNLYSLFFLKSASFFSSAFFVLLLVAIVIANESKTVRQKGVDVKMGLFVLCLFCSFSILFPLILGHVGFLTFLLSLAATAGFLLGTRKYLSGKVPALWIQRRLLIPGAAVVVALFVLYQLKLIPPVPLAVTKMGVYHSIEKADGKYLLQHERPWWKFWRTGDQDFAAAPGDKVYFFARIFSPARFDDTVVLHWWQKDARGSWQSTDKIPMRVVGGRALGFRGFSVKQNYSLGDWCVAVETTDGREIGRMYFNVSAAEQPLPGRIWQTEEE